MASSVEEVVRLLVHLLVGHLLKPSSSHVSLAGGLLVAELVVLSLLDHQGVPQVVEVLLVLGVLARTVVSVLIVQLVHKAVVVPCSLSCVVHVHLVDDFLVLLGSVVGLVVLLAVVFILSALLGVPVTLLVDESLVQLQVSVSLVTCLLCLSTTQLNVVVELVLLGLTLLLETDQVFFITLEGGEGSLVSNCHLLLVVRVTVAQTVVVVAERSI